MRTILYVKESTSGEYVGNCYTVDLSKKPLEITDGEGAFSPNKIEKRSDGKVIAYNDHFRIVCEIVGTIPEAE